MPPLWPCTGCRPRATEPRRRAALRRNAKLWLRRFHEARGGALGPRGRVPCALPPAAAAANHGRAWALAPPRARPRWPLSDDGVSGALLRAPAPARPRATGHGHGEAPARDRMTATPHRRGDTKFREPWRLVAARWTTRDSPHEGRSCPARACNSRSTRFG